jgi:hypothetical protein
MRRGQLRSVYQWTHSNSRFYGSRTWGWGPEIQLAHVKAVIWVVAPCSLIDVYQRFRGPCSLHHQVTLMMEASRPSETLVNVYQITRRYNPDDSHLRTHRGENLKSYWLTLRLVAGSCEHNNELSDAITGAENLNQLRNYQLLKEYSTLLIYLVMYLFLMYFQQL